MAVFLGIDVSTTATKAVLVDDAGHTVGVAQRAHASSAPHALWSEQEPEAWWRGVAASIREVLEQTRTRDVAGIGLTGQMHGLVLLDARGEVLRPAILWNDGRTGAECDAIREAVGMERLVRITGNDALAGFTAPKMLWVRRHEPDVWARAAHVLLPKDYVRYRLTGALATDRAGASGTLLLDLAARDWSAEVVAALGLDPALLPPTHEGTEPTGAVSDAGAAATGLRAGTPVFAGGGDQAAAAVGTGAVSPGVVSVSLGTSGVVFAPTDAPRVEPEGRLHAFCHAFPGAWHLMGVVLSAGGSLGWLRETVAPGVPFPDLLGPAADIAPGADGLLFLPYLAGERTPHPDPLARGAFVGLTLRHGRAHLVRAVLEGVAFALRDSFELIRATGAPTDGGVRVTGGGARSALWCQILADVLGEPVATVEAPEGAAFGAALLAAVGVGAWPSVPEACRATVRVGAATEPTAVPAYAEAYARYQGLYPALRPLTP